MSVDLLINILATENKALEAAYAKVGETAPSLDTPPQPSATDSDPEVIRIRQTIVAAANQIIQTVRPAHETLILEAFGVLSTSALGVAEEFNIADVLDEADPQVCAISAAEFVSAYHPFQGLHVEEISAKAGVDVPGVGECENR